MVIPIKKLPGCIQNPSAQEFISQASDFLLNQANFVSMPPFGNCQEMLG
jgi:hypothetical protein